MDSEWIYIYNLQQYILGLYQYTLANGSKSFDGVPSLHYLIRQVFIPVMLGLNPSYCPGTRTGGGF